jgi:hypothetical protein
MATKKWVSAGMLGLGLCSVMGPVCAQRQNTCTFEVRTRSKVGYRGSARYFIKGNWVREEKRSGGGLELIMVSNDAGLFIRNKHAPYWFKYPGGVHIHLKDRLLGGPIGEVPQFLKSVHAKPVGKEKLKNEMCEIYFYQYPHVPDKFRLWVSEKTGKPLQLTRDHKVRITGGTTRDILVVDYRSYDTHTPVQDALFQISAKEKVHDMTPAFIELGRTLKDPAAVQKVLSDAEKPRLIKKSTTAVTPKTEVTPKK